MRVCVWVCVCTRVGGCREERNLRQTPCMDNRAHTHTHRNGLFLAVAVEHVLAAHAHLGLEAALWVIDARMDDLTIS